jgi:hypothetical protein
VKRLARGGVTVELPERWSGRLFAGRGDAIVLHAASFALPLDDGAFGDQSTGIMRPGSAFVALTEYLPGGDLKPGAGLFASPRIPVALDPTSFSERRLAHPRPGQSGSQQFFTVTGRPFCLYVVLAASRSELRVAGAGRHPQLPAVRMLLRSLRVSSRSEAA